MSKVRYQLRRRTEKRLQAKERDAVAASRTPEQQLARLNAAGHRAEAERARLKALIEARRKAA